MITTTNEESSVHTPGIPIDTDAALVEVDLEQQAMQQEQPESPVAAPQQPTKEPLPQEQQNEMQGAQQKYQRLLLTFLLSVVALLVVIAGLSWRVADQNSHIHSNTVSAANTDQAQNLTIHMTMATDDDTEVPALYPDLQNDDFWNAMGTVPKEQVVSAYVSHSEVAVFFNAHYADQEDEDLRVELIHFHNHGGETPVSLYPTGDFDSAQDFAIVGQFVKNSNQLFGVSCLSTSDLCQVHMSIMGTVAADLSTPQPQSDSSTTPTPDSGRPATQMIDMDMLAPVNDSTTDIPDLYPELAPGYTWYYVGSISKQQVVDAYISQSEITLTTHGWHNDQVTTLHNFHQQDAQEDNDKQVWQAPVGDFKPSQDFAIYGELVQDSQTLYGVSCLASLEHCQVHMMSASS